MLNLLRELGNALPIPFIVYNRKGEIVYVNRAFRELSEEISAEEVVGKSILDFVHPEDGKRAKDAMKRRLSGERVEPYSVRVKDKYGRYRIYQVVGGVGQFMGEKFGIITLSDVTKFEEQKVMLLILTRALRHDVLNALTAAESYLEFSKELCGDCENYNILQKLEMSIERAVKIIKNLRDFEEAVVEGKLEKIDVRDVVEDVAKNFDIPVVVECDCEVVADRGLRTIFENLFQNAIQHGGTDRIEVRMKRVGDFCEIRVVDYGRGIPEEIKDKIFDEGFAYGKAASTGQGLYLVKKLVERYGGEIWVENNQPNGSVFVLRLRSWSL